ncbi:phage tail terminator family protein, partial [Clostridioides difficile]
MLTNRDIIIAVNKRIENEFRYIDIFINEDNIQGFEEACFFVQLLPVSNNIANKVLDTKKIFIDIEYYQKARKNKLNLYDIQSRLEKIFNRNIRVKDRSLIIENISPSIAKDPVGYKLTFLMTVSYFEEVYFENETFEIMESVDLEIG